MIRKISFLPVTVIFCLMASCAGNNTQGNVLAEHTIDSLRHEIDTLNIIEEREVKEEANKKLVADMYQQLFGDKDTSSIDKYLTTGYIQHNPMLPDGSDALKKAVVLWFAGQPREKIDIRHIGADGDLVYIQTKSKMGTKTMSVIDIYRIENGKIAEHWDVSQEVPAKSANPHPMF